MAKSVKSKDPRKKIIMDKLKQESKGRKVTNVTEVSPGVFEGDCMEQRPGSHSWFPLGRFFVQFELNLDGSLGQHINGGLK